MSVNNRGKKILLVDDDQALRTVLAEQLDLYDGFNTIQVGTAAEGLEKAKLAHYDAILLDIGLPDMDGRELCKLMRRQGVRSPGGPAFGSRQVMYCTARHSSSVARIPGSTPAANSLPMLVSVMIP